MSDCASCSDPLPSGNEFAVCSQCHLNFHYECADILESTWNRMGAKRRELWKCKDCNARKSSQSSQSKEPSIPKDLIAKLHEEFLIKMEETITLQFSKYEKNFGIQMAEFKNSMDFFSKKIDDYEVQVTELISKVKSLEKSNSELKLENSNLKKEVDNYQLKVESLDQYNRNRNLQLEGIPESNNEQLDDVILKIADKIKEPIQFQLDIQAIHRVPTKRSKGPKPIIVQFTNRLKRDSFLKKSKQCNMLSSDFVPGVPNTRVFINEHLTPYNKNLLYQAKKLKGMGFSFVWPSQGRIFVKKTPSDKKVYISSINDLNKLAGCDIEHVQFGQGANA